MGYDRQWQPLWAGEGSNLGTLYHLSDSECIVEIGKGSIPALTDALEVRGNREAALKGAIGQLKMPKSPRKERAERAEMPPPPPVRPALCLCHSSR